MPHSYYLIPTLEENQESAPVILSIYTDDDGVIQRIGSPSYRSGDAAMKQLLVDWHEYVQNVGSPPGAPAITLFWEFVVATYGTAYKVGQRY